MRVHALQRLAVALRTDRSEHDPVLVVREAVVHLDAERAAAEFEGFAEVRDDGVDALVFSGRLIMPRDVPHDALGEVRGAERVQIPLGERVMTARARAAGDSGTSAGQLMNPLVRDTKKSRSIARGHARLG